MKLVLLRHGESLANKENIFTGWLEEPLTEKGMEEARMAGQVLKDLEIHFDAVHTSMQDRSIKSAGIVLDCIRQLYLPVHNTWRLNERHYGAIQGLNKQVTAEQYGKELVNQWRRSYAVRPPQAELFYFDRRYDSLDKNTIRLGESLKDTLDRLLPYWQDKIVPELLDDKNVLVISHGNTLRAFVKHLEGMSDEAIEHFIIYNGEMFIYELDKKLQILKKEVYAAGLPLEKFLANDP